MNSITLEQVVGSLRLDQVPEEWKKDWDLSGKTFEADKVPFLSPEYVSGACKELSMSEEVTGACIGSLKVFESSVATRRLAWHCNYLLFGPPKKYDMSVKDWPMFTGDMSLFYALVFLSGLPFVKRLYKEKGIPEDIFKDTLSDLELWIIEDKKRYGVYGLRQIGWLTNHFLGKLYKLGRLQFTIETYKSDFNVFRNRINRSVIILAGDGLKFRQDGQFDGANGISDKGAWNSKFSIKNGFISGNPVAPEGKALPVVIKLPASEWEQVLCRGDAALGVHIPATGPMAHAECGESFKKAVEFFPEYLPEHEFKAFICDSWLLDHQFEQYLPETSNIVSFMREVYLVPEPEASDSQTIERVFGIGKFEIEKAPQETSLQRIIVAHMKAGGKWRAGGFVLLPEDLRWGEQVYRKDANLQKLLSGRNLI